ncbi:hypothetical protein JXJ21_26200 [candidate division KSB1 bacterium]|nr:hypothetical protein [candidate division KSB1 bacterium]
MNRTALIIMLCLFICSYTPGFAQAVNLPLDHWAYEFLERMETRGFYRYLGGRTLPLSRTEIAKIFIDIEESQKNNAQKKLSATERALLEQFKSEFSEELLLLEHKQLPGTGERHLFTWREDDNTIHADFDIEQILDIKKGEQYDPTERLSHTTLGGALRGRLKGSLGFHIRVRNTMHRGMTETKGNFDPSKGLPLNLTGKSFYSDEAIAYFVWKLPWFELEVGRDNAKWGPGYRGSLVLSAENPLFDMIKLKAQFRRFQFTSIHGNLNSSLGQKYIAAHRLELKVCPWLFVAGSEAVIYGNRGIEFQYLNPLMPYHVAEHHLGDLDNNTMGFDIAAFPLQNLKTYFELFLDDYTLSKNPFTYYGNKFAFLAGGAWVDPFGLENSEFRLEYARLEPWVYTHKDTINIYENYNQSIGHWLGPDADDWFAEINYRPIRDLKFTFSFERVRNSPATITESYNRLLGERKHFLSGIIEHQRTFGFKISDQLFRDTFLSLSIFYVHTKNVQNTENQNSRDTLASFEFKMNY